MIEGMILAILLISFILFSYWAELQLQRALLFPSAVQYTVYTPYCISAEQKVKSKEFVGVVEMEDTPT